MTADEVVELSGKVVHEVMAVAQLVELRIDDTFLRLRPQARAVEMPRAVEADERSGQVSILPQDFLDVTSKFVLTDGDNLSEVVPQMDGVSLAACHLVDG